MSTKPRQAVATAINENVRGYLQGQNNLRVTVRYGGPWPWLRASFWFAWLVPLVTKTKTYVVQERQGRSYFQVDYENNGEWLCPYDLLQQHEIPQSELIKAITDAKRQQSDIYAWQER